MQSSGQLGLDEVEIFLEMSESPGKQGFSA
jgi:hypothetical protein